ncbi:MAG: 3-deoxy-D-manno-octulosonic acid kinase [Steroidobacteraceae bacterium]
MERRIATPRGAMLADLAHLGNSPDAPGETLFEPQFWASRGELAAAGTGRGAVWFIASGSRSWVLRHYRRGGFMARISLDRYLWSGEPRVRAFAEYRLLARLAARGLPVPVPIAARYRRDGLSYRCDLVMLRIPDAVPLSSLIAEAPLGESAWRAIGAAIARLHRHGVDHADLNAHNILLDRNGAVSIVDFDRARLRNRGAWTSRNLLRLHRSLAKVSRDSPSDRFPLSAWGSLLAGYESYGLDGAQPL